MERMGCRNATSVLLVFILILNSLVLCLTPMSIADRSNNNYDSLSYSFYFSEPAFNEKKLHSRNYTTINMPGCMSIGRKVGEPVLPVKYVKFLLPPGKKVAYIYITGYPVEIEKTNVELDDKPVLPYQTPVPIGEEPPETLDYDDTLYSSPNAYPSGVNENLEIGYCRGYPILSLSLNPVQYIPGEGQLLYFEEITINIELDDEENFNNFFRNNIDDEKWVKTLVNNPEIVEEYNNDYFLGLSTFSYSGGLCDPSDSYDYVIITTTYNNLDNWSTSPTIPHNWTSLMDKHESDDGLSCTLVTIQDINACTDYWNATSLFNDTPAHIREFCRDAYLDWETDYIFIGGDDEWIPAREMDYGFELNVDSDIYWNHLDNTFNDDEDSYWGEEGDSGFDLYAEMYIGRITCDEPQDVSNWMNKSFYYADATLTDYLDNAAFYAGDTEWLCEGDDFIDYSAIQGTDDWLGPDPESDGSYPSWLGFQYGFETWNIVNPTKQFNLSVRWTAETLNTGWLGGSEAAAITGLRNAINNDSCTLISGIAHADEYSSLDVSYTVWESSYHNTKPFFLHDYGCHCGDMDAADDGVLHSMLFHDDTELAFACVYNTGYGWGNGDSTNSSSSLQQKCFWDYFFDVTNNSGSQANWQLGKAMAYARDTMAPTISFDPFFGTWRAIIQGCLLFGDPAQRLKIGPEDSITLSDESPTNQSSNISTGSLQFSINATDPEGDSMNITFRTNASGVWEDIGTNSSQQSGIYNQTCLFNNYSRTYWWSVNATDLTGSSGWTNETYCFTTESLDVAYVDDDYNSSTTGWLITCFNTIQLGINTVVNGGSVIVYNGTYNESINLNKNIILRAADNCTPIIDGLGSIGVNISVNNTVLRNISITNCSNGVKVFNTLYYIKNITITNNTIHNNSQNGIFIAFSNNNTISLNTVENNTFNGIIFENSSNNTIIKNQVCSNSKNGTCLINNSQNNTIYHNNLINNSYNNSYDQSNNTWYNTTLGGNYYDDYNGTDDDSDGFGDTPYNISGGTTNDTYPLITNYEYYYILSINAAESVNENTEFTVAVKTEGGSIIEGATVTFDDESQTTDSDGQTSFTSPSVSSDTIYSILASKSGYTNDSASITVTNVESPGGGSSSGGSSSYIPPIIIDTAPVIRNVYHEPSTITKQDFVTIYAEITDDNSISSAELIWDDSSEQYSIMLTKQEGNIYTATIGTFEENTLVSYWVNAIDDNSQTTISSEETFTVIDNFAPSINNIFPVSDSTIYDTKPSIKIDYSDPSGIDTETITLKIDDITVTPQILTLSELKYIPDSDLSYSTHIINFFISDLKGNSEKVEWSFNVKESQSISKQNFANIIGGQPNDITVEKSEESSINNIEITSNNDLTNVIMTIAELKEKPEEVIVEIEDKILFSYLHIDITTNDVYLEDEDFESLLISFKVEKKWMEDNKINKNYVTLLRYHGDTWEILTTKVIDEDKNYVYYEAVTPGTSTFAIVGEENTELNIGSNYGIPWFIIIVVTIIGMIFVITLLFKTGFLFFESKKSDIRRKYR